MFCSIILGLQYLLMCIPRYLKTSTHSISSLFSIINAGWVVCVRNATNLVLRTLIVSASLLQNSFNLHSYCCSPSVVSFANNMSSANSKMLRI